MKRFEYMKVPLSVLKYSNESHDIKFLSTYMYLYMTSNPAGYFYTSLDQICRTLEITYDTRLTKMDAYRETLDLMSRDILDSKNEVIMSQILDYDIYLNSKESEEEEDNKTKTKKKKSNISETPDIFKINGKDIILINLLSTNDDVTDSYLKVFFDEYDYLLQINKDYTKRIGRRLNLGTLVSLYLNIKYAITIHDTFSKNIVSLTPVSVASLCKKIGLANRTVNAYINILEDYKMITVQRSKPLNDKEYFANKYTLNSKWREDYYKS